MANRCPRLIHMELRRAVTPIRSLLFWGQCFLLWQNTILSEGDMGIKAYENKNGLIDWMKRVCPETSG